MKTLLRIFCVILSMTLVLFETGCSNDDIEQVKEIETKSLPHSIHSFLSNTFPDLTLEKAEKILVTDSITIYPYKVYLPHDITVEFDEEGIWQQINVSKQTPQEQLRPLLDDNIFSFLQANHPNEAITQVFHKEQGRGVTLDNNQTLLFQYFESRFLGYELEKEAYTSLPSSICDFIAAHFPNVAYKEIYYKKDETEKGDYTYLFYLDNRMELRFDRNKAWTLIEGNGQLLPASLIESLPVKVQKELQNYPTHAISRIAFLTPEYHIKVSDNTTVVINPDDAQPVVIPNEAINKFIKTHFGNLKQVVIRHPLHEGQTIFIVSIPNGFDFMTDKDGRWFKLDGHGYPVPESLIETLHHEIPSYISAHYDADITQIEIADSYRIVLTDGTGLLFDKQGTFIGTEEIQLNANEKTNAYIRYHYPKDLEAYCSYWDNQKGFIFTMEDGSTLRFDPEGNRID